MWTVTINSFWIWPMEPFWLEHFDKILRISSTCNINKYLCSLFSMWSQPLTLFLQISCHFRFLPESFSLDPTSLSNLVHIHIFVFWGNGKLNPWYTRGYWMYDHEICTSGQVLCRGTKWKKLRYKWSVNYRSAKLKLLELHLFQECNF